MKTEVCNIGPQNIKRRQTIGMVLLILAGFTSAILVAFNVPTILRIIVFPLFAIGFISLLQAARKVCVTNAYKKTVQLE